MPQGGKLKEPQGPAGQRKRGHSVLFLYLLDATVGAERSTPQQPPAARCPWPRFTLPESAGRDKSGTQPPPVQSPEQYRWTEEPKKPRAKTVSSGGSARVIPVGVRSRRRFWSEASSASGRQRLERVPPALKVKDRADARRPAYWLIVHNSTTAILEGHWIAIKRPRTHMPFPAKC
ncbi:hypothetical protein DFH27DRAFT_649712 [Peziza echinospora]|nr:hypothetical protein DFH27DRAFT_649712 [Peziza echinospora]